jgi:VCBS repeat-containing protein
MTPGAVNDTAATDQNTAITIDVLRNDLPAGIPKTLSSLSGTTSALGAKITIVNGRVVYDPSGDPTIAELAAGQSATDTFSYSMTEPGGKSYTANVTVNLTGLNDKPVISGMVANQPTTDTSTINPFTTASVKDVDNGAQDGLTITLVDSSGNVTDADGKLSGNGLIQTGIGTYLLSATNQATLSNELQSLTFTPIAHQAAAGSKVTTTFDMVATDQFGATGAGAASVVTTESPAPPPPPQPSIIGFGITFITVPNTSFTGVSSSANDINNSGEIVGNYSLPKDSGINNDTSYGFTYNNGVFSTVVVPGAVDTAVNSVNSQGDVAGTFLPSGASDLPGAFDRLGFVVHNGVTTTIPIASAFSVAGINDGGQVAVTSFQSGADVAYIYNENTGNLAPVSISDASNGVLLSDINNSGLAVGQYFTSFVTGGAITDHGFIYNTNNGNLTEYDAPGSIDTRIFAINDKGDFVGFFLDTSNRSHGFDVIGGVFADLGSFVPADINNGDLMVGSAFNDMLASGGALTKGQIIDFSPNNLTGQVKAVNDQNVVVGSVETGAVTGVGVGSVPIFATPITV